MAKKKILMKKSILNKILTDIYIPFYSKEIINRNIEDEVDDCIKKLLEPIFNEFIRVKKTGNKNIDNKIPTWHGESGMGKPDIMLYNYFSKEEISLIIENKNFTSKDNIIVIVTFPPCLQRGCQDLINEYKKICKRIRIFCIGDYNTGTIIEC